MNKSYRIRTEVGTNGDKHIKLKLDQEFDSFQILSLDIDQKDIYEDFNCDYGVVIGRVNANGGVGIPNVKMSIFIPITDEDSLRPEIKAIYPYESPRQKNSQGKRYNLLPRVAQEQPDGTVKPKQPFGTFPTKEELVTNDSWLEVYETYYKYSTVTNESGDFMLFGVPVGTQTVHMSADITDIGRFSMTPATMVTNLGYSPNLFNENRSRIKESDDLDDLPNIETQEISVDVIPFCGDSDNFDIGITRQDFRIRAELISNFVVFGAGFTDGDNEMWSSNVDGGATNIRELYRVLTESTSQLSTKRIAEITEQIFSYNQNLTNDEIEDGNTIDPDTDIFLVDDSTYGTFKQDGNFVFIIPCNRNKIITDEFGNDVIVPNNSSSGAFTTFSGFMTLEISEDTLPMNFGTSIGVGDDKNIIPLRHRYKFPQSSVAGQSFTPSNNDPQTDIWRKQYHTFEVGKLYSIAKFNATVFNNSETQQNPNYQGTGFISSDRVNDLSNSDYNWMTGILYVTDLSGSTAVFNNSLEEYPSNEANGFRFGANWINFSVHFMQNGRLQGVNNDVDGVRSNNNFFRQQNNTSLNFYVDNAQPFVGGLINTKWFARSDIHHTAFIEVPKEDVLTFASINRKGGKVLDLGLSIEGTDYRNGQSPDIPLNGGRLNGIPANPVDPEIYFYKGLDESDCIQYIIDLGLV